MNLRRLQSMPPELSFCTNRPENVVTRAECRPDLLAWSVLSGRVLVAEKLIVDEIAGVY